MHGILSRDTQLQRESQGQENLTLNVKCLCCTLHQTVYTQTTHKHVADMYAYVCFISLSVAVKFERQIAQQRAN